MIWTTIGQSLNYALLPTYWKNLSYPKFLSSSTLTIHKILVNQHIVQVTALKQHFWMLLMICNTTVLALLDFLQHLTQLIILSLYTVSILTLDLLMLSSNGFHLIWLIEHTTSHYIIIVLLLLLYTQVFLRVHGPILFTMNNKPLSAIIDTHSIIHHSFADDIQLQMSAPLIEYLSYFTLCSHV